MKDGFNVTNGCIPWHWTVLILLSQLHWDGHMAITWCAITINMASITAIMVVIMSVVTHIRIVMVFYYVSLYMVTVSPSVCEA